MDRITQITVTAGCIVIACVAWVVTVTSKTPAEKQLELIRQAQLMAGVGAYKPAVPLLEQAASYGSTHTSKAEEELKKAYLALIDSSGFARRYTGLLEKQMSASDASPEIYMEAAKYYMSINATGEALTILKDGIEKTGNAELTAFYETSRYAYEMSRGVYEEVTAIYDGTIAVKQGGKWGIINKDGSVLIPCEYDKVSTFHQSRAIVRKGDAIYAVDRDNHRMAVPGSGVTDFRNLSDSRTALLTQDGWRRSTWDFSLGSNVFEDIGMHAEGYAAVKSGGKWGVISVDGQWLIPAQYDDTIRDRLGRCCGQGAVFVREGELVYLFVNGTRVEGAFQDARPFTSVGCAAVMQNGKWGFVDIEGNTVTDYIYDDARSFSGHLAAVKKNGLWGYAGLAGDIVIDAVFLDAGSFDGGTAPVLTEKGWQLITLIEFKKTAGGLF